MTANHILILLGVLVFVQSVQVKHTPTCQSLLFVDSSGHPATNWIMTLPGTAKGCTENQIKDKVTIWSVETYNKAVALTNVNCTANATMGA